jgi:hypothetical protein
MHWRGFVKSNAGLTSLTGPLIFFTMKSKKVLCPLLVGLFSSLVSLAQFTPEELARRPQWEDFLSTAKIIKSERIGEGVSKPRKLLLKKGDIEASAVWKRPRGLSAGISDKWEFEVAAYRLDKLLGLGLVPPTVGRRHRMSMGALQLWVPIPINELRIKDENLSIPQEKLDNYEKMRSLQRAFDSLIANSDRTLQNLRYTEDWRMILIDHSRAFRDTFPYLDTLLYGRDGMVPQEFGALPRQFVAAVRSLDFDLVKEAVGGYLSNSEIKAILHRKDLFLQEIDDLIKAKGEEAVLY